MQGHQHLMFEPQTVPLFSAEQRALQLFVVVGQTDQRLWYYQHQTRLQNETKPCFLLFSLKKGNAQNVSFKTLCGGQFTLIWRIQGVFLSNKKRAAGLFLMLITRSLVLCFFIVYRGRFTVTTCQLQNRSYKCSITRILEE